MKCISIQVFVFVIGLGMNLAMSIDDELEDFSNFLKETSLLDQPLKKNPVDEDDDDVPISDHAWEESGRFEGDLILNDRQRQLIVQDIAEGLSRNGLKDSTKRWPNNEVVFYIQKEHFTSDQVQAILSGIEELSQASCVKFRPYRKGDRDAVVVQGSRRGCFSQVGYQGGYQVLNLSGRHPVGRGCFRHGTVVHEFLHTLGFYHMQSSPDRDDYIDVVWENIVQPARHNFRKYNLFSVSDFGVGYDYDSVLHYSRKAFSSNGGDTLVPKQSGAQIGQRIGLSDKDSAKLNKMYCDVDSNNFEAADDVPPTLVIKKKKTPKNKPFDGHGIGYHQGKTVVFKLPAAETYRLPETPSNAVFDYFSKAPQAMSPTLFEGFGVGKKISYSYELPAKFQIVERNSPVHRFPAVLNTTSYERKPATQQHNTQYEQTIPSIVDTGHTIIETSDFDEKPILEYTTKNTETINDNIRFKLYKYKPNTDYSEFYNPVNNYKHGTKTDYYLNYSPELKGNHETATPAITKLKLTRQFIENLHDPKSTHTDKYNKTERLEHLHHNSLGNKHETAEKSKQQTVEETTLRDADSLLGYINPSTKLEEVKKINFLNPQYTSKKYLDKKNDFTSLYSYPSVNGHVDPPSRLAQYSLFSELVPTSVNLTSKTDTHNKTFDTLKKRQDIDELKDGTTNISTEQTPYYRYDGNGDEYSYEDFEYYDPTKTANTPRLISSEENLSKSYEVTEKILEQVALVTDKPSVDSSKSRDVEHILEKRLPAILERYVNYDNYDITTPYLFPKHDENEYYSKT